MATRWLPLSQKRTVLVRFDEQAAKSERIPGFPKGIKANDIVLKRALEPLDEKITTWLEDCFSFQYTGWIEPRVVIISLFDENRGIITRWVCERAIPLKWSMAPFASESKVAMETIGIRCCNCL